MKKSTFSVSYTENTLTLKLGKYSLTWEVLKGKVIRDKSKNVKIDQKEIDNAGYLSKFVADYMPIIKGTWKSRIAKMATVLENLLSSGISKFRTLNNNTRKHFDDGSDQYWKNHFYEGIRKGTGVRSTKALMADAA